MMLFHYWLLIKSFAASWNGPILEAVGLKLRAANCRLEVLVRPMFFNRVSRHGLELMKDSMKNNCVYYYDYDYDD